ncbi:MFS transporter [Gordonia jinhuaensis]|uniref:MFS transporter n=2 Tax=Gordonia jinhuaensis TaxID=1517702 RepID=A0A916WT41_9ACTN|nr:MFS transporter [Gordonia jinhuaensis]GGB27198.1 MFS transporter [Gordonia jinhuaensis]
MTASVRGESTNATFVGASGKTGDTETSGALVPDIAAGQLRVMDFSVESEHLVMERKWWTLVVVCVATFMLLLDITIVVVALPDIQRSLGANFSQLQWVTDAYALALAALLLTSGSLSDRFGRRRIFVIGLVIFTLGSVLCGVAQDPNMLIASRAIQGVGGAMLFSTSLALLASTFHGKERGVAFGAWGAITGVSVALGPILGGLITTGISWRGIFLVNVPFGVIAIVIALACVDESKSPHARRIDWPGVLTFTVGLLALVYGLTEAGQRSWGDAVVVTSFIVAAVLLIAFVVIEMRVSEPMFDLSLFRTPTFVGGSIAAFTMNGSLFAMLLYLVIYLQDALGYTSLQTGVRLLLMSGCIMVFATISGRVSAHVPVRWLIGPGLLLVGVGLLLMMGITKDSNWTHLIPGLIIAGIGSGLVNPPLASTAVGVVEVHRSGMASGINNTFRQVGIAVGIAVYGSIFSALVSSSMRDHLSSTPVASRSSELSDAAHNGTIGQIITTLPPADRAVVGEAVHSAFADALNTLFLVSGIVAIIGGLCAMALVRREDFVVSHAPHATQKPQGQPA